MRVQDGGETEEGWERGVKEQREGEGERGRLEQGEVETGGQRPVAKVQTPNPCLLVFRGSVGLGSPRVGDSVFWAAVTPPLSQGALL